MEEKKDKQSGLRWYDWSAIVVSLLFVLLAIYVWLNDPNRGR